MTTAGRCPHADITGCPLYQAAHIPALAHLGCDDGHLATGGCAVDRGVSYADRVRQMSRSFVQSLRDRADDIARRLQHARNLRAAGLR